MASSISVHIQPLQFSKISGQTRHDLREKIPSYVDKTLTAENSVLIKPLSADELFSICRDLRKKRTDKPMKKNFRIGISGILTFSKDAQQVINGLDKEKQNELFKQATDKISEFLNVTVTGLVVHRDETALHMHFQMPAYDKQGFALSHIVDKSKLSQLQDVASEAFKEYNIGRGVKKEQRIQDGEDYSKYIHRSVKELHQDLPKEIEQKKQRIADLDKEIAEQQAKIEKNQRLILQNEQKLQAGKGDLEKINKNIEIYQKREADAAAAIEKKVTEKTKLNNEIQNQKQTFEKYQKILDTENPPKMPKIQLVEVKSGILKSEQKQIIELSDFKKYDNQISVWAAQTFDKENLKKKNELDKRESDINDREQKVEIREKLVFAKEIDTEYFKKELAEKNNLIQDTLKRLSKDAGIDTRNTYIDSRKAAEILKNYVANGISAVKTFWQKLQNSLSR